MRKAVKFAVLGVVAAGVLAVMPIGMATAQTGEQYTEMRRAAMKELSAHGKAIRAFVKGDKNPKRARALGTAGDVEFRAMAMAAMADRLHTMFAQKTSLKDLPGKTRAKPEIWSDWNDFYAQTRNLKKYAVALEQAAASGDKKKIGAAMADIGKQACSACHKKFRGPKPKK